MTLPSAESDQLMLVASFNRSPGEEERGVVYATSVTVSLMGSRKET